MICGSDCGGDRDSGSGYSYDPGMTSSLSDCDCLSDGKGSCSNKGDHIRSSDVDSICNRNIDAVSDSGRPGGNRDEGGLSSSSH